jgi:hypothetical protein
VRVQVDYNYNYNYNHTISFHFLDTLHSWHLFWLSCFDSPPHRTAEIDRYLPGDHVIIISPHVNRVQPRLATTLEVRSILPSLSWTRHDARSCSSAQAGAIAQPKTRR